VERSERKKILVLFAWYITKNRLIKNARLKLPKNRVVHEYKEICRTRRKTGAKNVGLSHNIFRLVVHCGKLNEKICVAHDKKPKQEPPNFSPKKKKRSSYMNINKFVVHDQKPKQEPSNFSKKKKKKLVVHDQEDKKKFSSSRTLPRNRFVDELEQT